MKNQQGAPEAPKGTASDGKTELFNVPGYPLMVRAVDFNRLHAENERLSGLCDKWNSECDEFREDNKRLAALVEAQPDAHVQQSAEIEHVAGDVSKTGPESNMAQQPAPSAAAALPEGWVPLAITHEGQYPEGVAYAKAQDAPAADAATVPEGWTDADADAARLALELECLLTDTKDQAAVSKWWTSANDALELHRARLAAPPQQAPVANRLLQLADELDEQLTSGAKWSPAQHACCSVSNALRAMLAEAPKPSPTPQADSAPAEAVQRIVHLRADRERRVYVAGPMTGLPEYNFPLFNATTARLRSEGWHVENPAEHGHVEGAGWSDYLRWDISRIATCGAIYLLPGWSKSKGATLEVHIAGVLGLQVLLADGAEAPQADSQPALPKITAEDRSFLHDNPNTDDIVEWVQNYANAAINADRAARALADSVLEDADPIRALIAEHAAVLDQNESAYFELCYHRATGWMAWITDKPLCMPPVVNPDRKVLAQGQGHTADEACRDAARKQGGL